MIDPSRGRQLSSQRSVSSSLPTSFYHILRQSVTTIQYCPPDLRRMRTSMRYKKIYVSKILDLNFYNFPIFPLRDLLYSALCVELSHSAHVAMSVAHGPDAQPACLCCSLPFVFGLHQPSKKHHFLAKNRQPVASNGSGKTEYPFLPNEIIHLKLITNKKFTKF